MVEGQSHAHDLDGRVKQLALQNIRASDWTRVLSLFDDLVDLTLSEQTAQINSVDMPIETKNLLKKMLASCDKPNILDKTIDPLVAELLGVDVVIDQAIPDNIIGRYFGVWRVVDTLASGGMGQVFLAERADGQFEKKVALKVIKSGQFSELSKQRFLTEMQMLAKFEHPNIAHLIDGGTSEDGITYFVMELIIGEPIVNYANAQNLPLTERIKLVLQVIDAVEYAHQSLVIHGDIKPANILVNESSQVKLVDFGIARSLDNENDSFLPQFTPSYSSPEQAQGLVLTTASDVFGLCAVLYELCTGSSPRKNEALTTQIKLTEKINTPITAAYTTFRTNQSRHTQQLPNYKKNKEFGQALSQELGAIIDKGLQIAVVNRYKNTTELRRDLLLFLEGSAVPTFANSWFYRWRKVVTKYHWTVAFSSLAILSIVMVAMIAINQARLAQQEADKASWANQFLLSIFDHADPIKNQQQPITVNQLTAQVASQIMEDDSDLLLKTTSLAMLSQIQYKLGEVESAEQLVKEQINLMQKLPVEVLALAAVYVKAGNILESQDKIDEAISYYRQAIKLAPLTKSFTEPSVRANLALANCLLRLNKLSETQQLVEGLISEESRIQALPAADSLLATLYAVKANLLLSEQQFTAAIEQLQIAKELAKKVADDPLLYPHILSMESDANYESGDLNSAAEIDRELVDYFSQNFGEDHPETIDKLGQLAVSLAALGELSAAITINQRILTNLKGTEIKSHQIPAAYLNMGTAYQALGDDLKAIENFQIAQTMWLQLEPRITLYEASTDVRLAQSLLNLKRYSKAQMYFESALDQIEKEFGKDHALYARFQVMYAPLLLAQNRLEEARSVIPSAYQRLVAVYGEGSKNAAVANLRWAQLNALLGYTGLAEEQAAAVIKILDVDSYRKRNQDLIDEAKQIIKSTD